MAAPTSALQARGVDTPALPPLRLTVLARLANETGASKSELVRDLAPLLAPRLSPAEARLSLERALATLVMIGLAREDNSRFMASAAGAHALAERFGAKAMAGRHGWPEMRDVWLLARALGIEGEPPARLKRLAKPDGLHNAIVQKAYGMAIRPESSPSKIRMQLAVIALERAFGNKIKSGFDQGGLSAKAGRKLAAQLCAGVREFGTDARLVAGLAAEHAGSRKPDADALRLALLRRWLGVRLELESEDRTIAALPLKPAPLVAANDAASARPDLAGFSTVVLDHARGRAEGWSGNRKAFICHVWQAIRDAQPEWRLTEIEFKCMLAEAHRAGLVVLANADLKDKRFVKEVQDSAIAYKNTVWHLVRVED